MLMQHSVNVIDAALTSLDQQTESARFMRQIAHAGIRFVDTLVEAAQKLVHEIPSCLRHEQ
jgi:hypothetical protein